MIFRTKHALFEMADEWGYSSYSGQYKKPKKSVSTYSFEENYDLDEINDSLDKAFDNVLNESLNKQFEDIGKTEKVLKETLSSLYPSSSFGNRKGTSMFNKNSGYGSSFVSEHALKKARKDAEKRSKDFQETVRTSMERARKESEKRSREFEEKIRNSMQRVHLETTQRSRGFNRDFEDKQLEDKLRIQEIMRKKRIELDMQKKEKDKEKQALASADKANEEKFIEAFSQIKKELSEISFQ